MRPYNDSVRKEILPYVAKGNEYFDKVAKKESDSPEKDLRSAFRQYKEAWEELDDVYSNIKGSSKVAKDSKGQDVDMIRKSLKQRMSTIEKTLEKIDQRKTEMKNPFTSSEKHLGYASIVLLGIALIFVSTNLTGNAIASNPNLSNGISVALFLSGLAFAFFYFKSKRKEEEKKKAKEEAKKRARKTVAKKKSSVRKKNSKNSKKSSVYKKSRK